MEFPYDSYTRMILDKDELEEVEGKQGGGPASRRGSKLKGQGHLFHIYRQLDLIISG
jgi:hypothetical protein